MFLPNGHRIDLQAPETSSHSPALGCSSKYRTLCDLPVELLAIIVSHNKRSRGRHRAWQLAKACRST